MPRKKKVIIDTKPHRAVNYQKALKKTEPAPEPVPEPVETEEAGE